MDPVSVRITEHNAAASLKLVLTEVIMQNDACTVLTDFAFEEAGTAQARIVLTFDDAKCQASQIAVPAKP